MSGTGPQWSWARFAGGSGVPDSEMRISDAERSEVADALGKHFADGRLDQAEFDARLHQTMSAKTRGDLSGLLADLPSSDPPPPPAPPRRFRFARLRLAGLVVLGFFLFAVASAPMWHWRFPWIVLAIMFFVLWRRGRGDRHRRRWQGQYPPPYPYGPYGYGPSGSPPPYPGSYPPPYAPIGHGPGTFPPQPPAPSPPGGRSSA